MSWSDGVQHTVAEFLAKRTKRVCRICRRCKAHVGRRALNYILLIYPLKTFYYDIVLNTLSSYIILLAEIYLFRNLYGIFRYAVCTSGSQCDSLYLQITLLIFRILAEMQKIFKLRDRVIFYK